MIAGVDEAGRGAWAGEVYAAAVILPPVYDLPFLTDSKKLSARRREALFDGICAQALAWSAASASVEEIDALNILQATMLAMQRAVAGLKLLPQEILIDGNRVPQDLPAPARAVIGGDVSEAAVSAASIVAKVSRDRRMQALDAQYPGYGFAGHKGYGTAEHRQALARLGVSAVHRRSYAPIKRFLSPSLF